MIYFNFELIFLDYVVLILTAIIILFSFWKGFINSILSLLTWVGSIFITIYTYQYLTEFIDSLLLSISFLQNFEQFVNIISVILSIPIIFLISIFILRRIRKFLSSDLDKQILGIIFDKIFGIVYGIIFAYLIFSSAIYLSDKNNIVLDSNILNKISEYNYNIIETYSFNK
tara:strand:+ start:1123 stop:1635 length:513 start_codon:yes stop_codon:yes gene_type:complete